MVPNARAATPPSCPADPEAARSSDCAGSDPDLAALPDGAKEAAPTRPGSPAAVAARARDAAIAASILRLVAERGPARSICPSEAAREVAAAEGLEEWHRLMGNVRRIAGSLQAEGRVEILRKGRTAAADVRGVIRLRQPPAATDLAPPDPEPHAAAASPAEPAVPA